KPPAVKLNRSPRPAAPGSRSTTTPASTRKNQPIVSPSGRAVHAAASAAGAGDFAVASSGSIIVAVRPRRDMGALLLGVHRIRVEHPRLRRLPLPVGRVQPAEETAPVPL